LTLTAGGLLTATGSFRVTPSALTAVGYTVGPNTGNSDVLDRLQILGNGKLQWGDIGALGSTYNVNLYRAGVNALATDVEFRAPNLDALRYMAVGP
jgi:hypothetical protein